MSSPWLMFWLIWAPRWRLARVDSMFWIESGSVDHFVPLTSTQGTFGSVAITCLIASSDWLYQSIIRADWSSPEVSSIGLTCETGAPVSGSPVPGGAAKGICPSWPVGGT